MSTARNRSFFDRNQLASVMPYAVLGALLLGGAIIYGHTQAIDVHFFVLWTSELGVALLIACIVYLVFEATAKRNHDKDILAYLYGIRTGTPYFKLVEDYIIRCPFFRTNTEVVYRFKDSKGESYLIEYEISFDLENVSQVSKKYAAAGVVILKSLYVSEDDIKGWQLGVTSIEFPQHKKIKRPEVSEFIRPGTPHSQSFAAAPIILKSGQRVHVVIKQQIAKHDHDSDVWQAAVPSDGVKLRLEWLKKWNLKFDLEAIHPNEEFLEVGDPEIDGDSCSQSLILDQPFLIRHGIHFSWVTENRVAKREPLTVADELGPKK